MRVLTRVVGGLISAAPPGQSPGGMLFEIVETLGRDARTAAEGRLMFVHLRTFGGPCMGPSERMGLG
jgi:hypothetical protein